MPQPETRFPVYNLGDREKICSRFLDAGGTRTRWKKPVLESDYRSRCTCCQERPLGSQECAAKLASCLRAYANHHVDASTDDPIIANIIGHNCDAVAVQNCWFNLLTCGRRPGVHCSFVSKAREESYFLYLLFWTRFNFSVFVSRVLKKQSIKIVEPRNKYSSTFVNCSLQ